MKKCADVVMLALIAAGGANASLAKADVADITQKFDSSLSSAVAPFTPPAHLLEASLLALSFQPATEDHDHDSGGDHDHVHNQVKKAAKGSEASFSV